MCSPPHEPQMNPKHEENESQWEKENEGDYRQSADRCSLWTAHFAGRLMVSTTAVFFRRCASATGIN